MRTMYRLIGVIRERGVALEEIASLGISLAVAQRFYVFHNFALEALAFLATWYAVDLTIAMGLRAAKASRRR
jgi:hypothetical protein